MDKIKADPLALNAVICTVLKGPSTTPDDFKRATLVDSFSMIYQKFPDWAEPTPGDFSILGLLENMHTLHFPNKPGRAPIQVDDFSFLARCKRLKRLDVARTNFTDCSILLQLPFMSYVHLPPGNSSPTWRCWTSCPGGGGWTFSRRPPRLFCQNPSRNPVRWPGPLWRRLNGALLWTAIS